MALTPKEILRKYYPQMKIFLPPNGGRKTVETTFFFRGAFMALTRQKKSTLRRGEFFMARLRRKNGLRLNAAKKQNLGEKSSREVFIVSNTKSTACNNLSWATKRGEH